MKIEECEGTIDAAALEEMRGLAVGAGPGVFEDVLQSCLVEGGRRMRELLAALGTHDAPRAERAARALRCVSGCVGARRLALLSQEIEEAARGGLIGRLGARAEAATAEFGRVREALAPLSRTGR
jgi:hypothetical protein